MDLKSLDFKSINLKYKSKSKFPNTTYMFVHIQLHSLTNIKTNRIVFLTQEL